MSTKSDFMSAEEIKAILQGRDKTEQERIIRWVCESLGISGSRSPEPFLAQQHTSSPTGQILQASATGQRKDIKSFVTEKSPKSDVQFAAVMAYFYRFEVAEAERKEVILPQDLQDAGRQARGFGFKKPLATLNNAVALGYFDRGGRGEFKLNAVGENLVAMTLPGPDSNGNKASRRNKKVTKGRRNRRRKKQQTT